MFPRDSSQPSREDEPKQEKAEVSEFSPLLKIGTLVVIGAMAANVIGFRYSRWAVGKEIHRGWETRARNIAREAARARANARRQTGSDAHTRAHARAQAEREARAREQQRAEERAKEHARRERRAKEERDNTRRAYQRWEETFTNDNGTYQRRVRVEFDTRFEDMFRGPFGIPEEVLQEFLRAAQMSQARGRVEDFDAFRFWEQVHGTEWRQSGRGSGPHTGGTGRGSGMGSMFTGNRARHYAALGLRENATTEEVKAAYRKEVMKWHPDRYRGPDKAGAEKKFRQVTEAYEALK